MKTKSIPLFIATHHAAKNRSCAGILLLTGISSVAAGIGRSHHG